MCGGALVLKRQEMARRGRKALTRKGFSLPAAQYRFERNAQILRVFALEMENCERRMRAAWEGITRMAIGLHREGFSAPLLSLWPARRAIECCLAYRGIGLAW